MTYIHQEHLGSSSVVTEASGTLDSAMTYLPYGETRDATGALPTERQFTGQRFDGGSGLYFYNARYYDAALGRFISADSIVPGTVDPQAFNRYSYVRNNPLKYTDPTGHLPWLAMAAGALVGAAVDAGSYALQTSQSDASFSWGKFAQSAARGAVSGALFRGLGGGKAIDLAAGRVRAATHGALEMFRGGVSGGVGYVSTGAVADDVSVEGTFQSIAGGAAGGLTGGVIRATRPKALPYYTSELSESVKTALAVGASDLGTQHMLRELLRKPVGLETIRQLAISRSDAFLQGDMGRAQELTAQLDRARAAYEKPSGN